MVRSKGRRRRGITEGGAQLAAYVSTRGNQARLAERIGVAAGTMVHWVRGDRLPSARYRHALQDEIRIDPRAWDREASADFIRSLEREQRGAA